MPLRLAMLAVILAALIAPPVAAQPEHWLPVPLLRWQIQFSGRLDISVASDVFDLDLFDTEAETVDRLHALGRRVVCYINVGAWENWRADARRFPAAVRGRRLAGWPGERWLDIRRVDLLGPVLIDRLELCRAKGFDGVEFDNVDGYANRTGFALTERDQLEFNRWLADAAHDRRLAVGLKNTLELAAALEPHFDFAILEQCFAFDECQMSAPFRDAGKAVLDVEYEIGRARFCNHAAELGISAMRKHLRLDAWRRPC